MPNRQTYRKLFGVVFSSIILSFGIGCSQPKSNDISTTTTEEDSIRIWVDQSKVISKDNPKKSFLLNTASQKALLVSNDSLRCKYLSEISFQLLSSNDSLQFKTINRKALRLAESIKDSVCLSMLHWDLGDFFQNIAVRDSAYYHLAKAEAIYASLGNVENSGKLLYSMAKVQSLVGDFTGSNSTVIKAIQKLKPLESYRQLYYCYNLLADNAKLLNEYESSIAYYDETLQYLRKADMGSIQEQSLKNNIGLVYQKQGKHEKAIVYFSEVIAYDSLRYSNSRLFARALNNLGRSKLKIINYGLLPDLFTQALEIQEGIYDIGGQVSSNYQLAQYHLAQKDSLTAFTNLIRAKELAQLSNDNKFLLEILRLFSKVDPNSATTYMEAYAALNDSLQFQERKIRDKFARISFQTNEISAKNELLARENQLWVGIAVTILLLGISTFIILNQRAKNQRLRFREQQQASNQEIFNLLLAQNEKVEEGKKSEQKRVSEELHDGVLGRMLGTRMMLLGLNKKTDPEAIAERAKAISILQEVESEVRTISHELSHAAYQKIHNFILSIKDLLKTVQGTSKIDIDFDYADDLDYDALNGEIKINLYRMIQECIHNAVKHAECKRINVIFGADVKSLNIIIADDGKGYVVKKGKKGIGTRNITSRMQKIQGSWNVDSVVGKGTTVTLTIPINTNNNSASIKIVPEELQEF